MLWVGEWEAPHRVAPELADLVTVLHQEGVSAVASALRSTKHADAPRGSQRDGHSSAAADRLANALWTDVDTDTTSSDVDRDLRISLDVLLVHHMLPLATALSTDKLHAARISLLSAVAGTPGHDSSATDSDSAASAASIAAAVHTACGARQTSPCEIKEAAPGRLIVKVPLALVDEAVAALANQPPVHWLSLHVSPHVANFYGTAIGQSGTSPATYDIDDLGNTNKRYSNEGKNPFWTVGLDVSTIGQQSHFILS